MRCRGEIRSIARSGKNQVYFSQSAQISVNSQQIRIGFHQIMAVKDRPAWPLSASCRPTKVSSTTSHLRSARPRRWAASLGCARLPLGAPASRRPERARCKSNKVETKEAHTRSAQREASSAYSLSPPTCPPPRTPTAPCSLLPATYPVRTILSSARPYLWVAGTCHVRDLRTRQSDFSRYLVVRYSLGARMSWRRKLTTTLRFICVLSHLPYISLALLTYVYQHFNQPHSSVHQQRT